MASIRLNQNDLGAWLLANWWEDVLGYLAFSFVLLGILSVALWGCDALPEDRWQLWTLFGFVFGWPLILPGAVLFILFGMPARMIWRVYAGRTGT